MYVEKYRNISHPMCFFSFLLEINVSQVFVDKRNLLFVYQRVVLNMTYYENCISAVGTY